MDDDGINKEYVTTVGNVSTGVATIVVDGKGYIFWFTSVFEFMVL